MAIAHAEGVTTVTYVLDADAQIAAARANLWRYLRSSRAWIRMGIGLLVMLAIGAVLGVAIGEDPLWWMLVFAAEMAVLFPLIYGLLYLFLPRRIRRLVAQSAIWRRPVEVTWSTAGMSARSPHGETELAWTDYHGWYAARSGFLLYFNDQQYQVVPASALAAGQAQALRAILEASGLRRL
ncbi:YcxB family protein [Sphingomonas sp. CBMAI 2297]|nr:YcxB family protein [Sphingomonas sp. CBMAI 2297]